MFFLSHDVFSRILSVWVCIILLIWLAIKLILTGVHAYMEWVLMTLIEGGIWSSVAIYTITSPLSWWRSIVSIHRWRCNFILIIIQDVSVISILIIPWLIILLEGIVSRREWFSLRWVGSCILKIVHSIWGIYLVE